MGGEITNIYKFLFFYHFDIFSASKNRRMESFYDAFVNKQKKFSEVSSWLLLTLRKVISKRPNLNKMKTELHTHSIDVSAKKTIEKLLPVDSPEYKKKLDEARSKPGFAMFEKSIIQELEYHIYVDFCMDKYFPDDMTLREYYKNFRRDIDEELSKRESDAKRELAEYGWVLHADLKEEELLDTKAVKRAIKAKLAKEWGMKISEEDLRTPDSLRKKVTEYLKKEVSKVTSLEQLDSLCAFYTTAGGGDLINGFLRGDLLLKSSTAQPKEKASWGTDLHVDFLTFLDIARQALTFKYILYGKALKPQTVYRGVSVKRFMASFDNNFNDKKKINEICAALSETPRDINKINSILPIIYTSNYITSTSSSSVAASRHAYKAENDPEGKGAVFMEIKIKEGTAFGKDFSETSFSESDTNKEIVLKPKQKIRILKIDSNRGILVAECETVV